VTRYMNAPGMPMTRKIESAVPALARRVIAAKRREGHRPLVAALDLRRPAAVDQATWPALQNAVRSGVQIEDALEGAKVTWIGVLLSEQPVLGAPEQVGLQSAG